MTRDREIEDFPVGTSVLTPSGARGVVEKARGHESKEDHFPRLVIRIGPGARDTVVLQPGLLRLDEARPPAPAAQPMAAPQRAQQREQEQMSFAF